MQSGLIYYFQDNTFHFTDYDSHFSPPYPPHPPSLPPEAAFSDSAAFAAMYQTVTEVVIILRSLSAAWNDVYDRVRVPGRSRRTLVGPQPQFRRRRFGVFSPCVRRPAESNDLRATLRE